MEAGTKEGTKGGKRKKGRKERTNNCFLVFYVIHFYILDLCQKLPA